uniref:Tetraspanin-33 n=1 Tax=Zonotrichia albicollis TaxID=44394 RepID=A0A8D2M4T6_ZONAL
MACLAVDPAILLIVVGVLTFLITFCGCVGSLRENICLLQVFSVCLTIIFLLQLAAGALGFVFSDKAREKVSELINGAIVHYRDDLDLQNLIDFGQKEFSCCGGVSYKDWSQNMYFNCTATNPSRERCSVPFSCCLHDADQVCAGVALGTLPVPVLPAPGAGLGLEPCPRAGNPYGPHPTLWVWVPPSHPLGLGSLIPPSGFGFPHPTLWVCVPIPPSGFVLQFHPLGLGSPIPPSGFVSPSHPLGSGSPSHPLGLFSSSILWVRVPSSHTLGLFSSSTLWVWVPPSHTLGLGSPIPPSGFGFPHPTLWVWVPPSHTLGLGSPSHTLGLGSPSHPLGLGSPIPPSGFGFSIPTVGFGDPCVEMLW